MAWQRARPTPFFGNICLSWLLSVCHHSSLSESEGASSNGEKIGRGGRKEGEGKRERATSSHGLCFALAAANAKEGAKEEAEPLQSRPPQNQGKGRDGG